MNEKLKKRMEARKSGCEFMNEREKGDFINLECQTLTLQDAYKLHGDEGDFWAFIVEEETAFFYFANSSLAIILNDAEQIALEDGISIREVIAGTRIKIGAMERGKKGRNFRPVDLVD